MNTYEALQKHLTVHVYKRGRNAGKAPADFSKRNATHFLVEHQRSDDTMRVVMHQTALLTAHKDGRVVLNTNRWYGAPTTKKCMNTALYRFVGTGPSLHTGVMLGARQPLLYVNQKAYRYYDGMELDAAGNITSELQPFDMRRIARAESKEFAKELKESGFTDMFKLLYETATEPDQNKRTLYLSANNLRAIVTNPDFSDNWPRLIQHVKYERIGWSYVVRERRAAWEMLMSVCKRDMYETRPSTVFSK